jgi:hypothetical protein
MSIQSGSVNIPPVMVVIGAVLLIACGPGDEPAATGDNEDVVG